MNHSTFWILSSWLLYLLTLFYTGPHSPIWIVISHCELNLGWCIPYSLSPHYPFFDESVLCFGVWKNLQRVKSHVFLSDAPGPFQSTNMESAHLSLYCKKVSHISQISIYYIVISIQFEIFYFHFNFFSVPYYLEVFCTVSKYGGGGGFKIYATVFQCNSTVVRKTLYGFHDYLLK